MTPLVGDWDGNGTDTIGLYVQSTGVFFLKNTNAGGAADLAFPFGVGGATTFPLVGDWNADTTNTVGIYQNNTGAFFIRNSNTPGNADATVFYGPTGATPLTGDWNGGMH